MRTNTLTMVAALFLVAGGAAAQQNSSTTTQPDVAKTVPAATGDIPMVNQVDFGVRGTSYGSDSDPARYQRYRDLRDGGTVDRFRLVKDTDAYKFSLQADHVGYRDQRFFGSYTNYGT